jgi:hypothetical protein
MADGGERKIRAKRQDLGSGVRVEIGERVLLTIDDSDTEVTVSFPEEVASAIGPGSLTLSGDGIEKQTRSIATGERVGDQVLFRFGWKGPQRKVDLEASAGGRTVRLWQAQAAGDDQARLEWSGCLEELLPPPKAGSGPVVIAGNLGEHVAGPARAEVLEPSDVA